MNKLFIVITILVSLVVISCSGDSTSTGMVAKDLEDELEDEIVQSDNSVPSLQTGGPFKWTSGVGLPYKESWRLDPCDWKFLVEGKGPRYRPPNYKPTTRVISYRKLRRKKALVVATVSTGGYWGYGSWAYSTVVGALLDSADWCRGDLSSCRTWDINGNVCNSKSKKRRLRVTTPNGRQKWRTGKQYDIIWSTGARLCKSWGCEKVKILLLKGNKAYQWISKSTPNDGLYTWKISDTLPRGSNYKIKISSIARKPVSDRSDRNFTIR